MHSAAARTTTAVLLHTTKPARHEPSGLIMVVISMKRKSMKTSELWKKLLTMWYFAHSKEQSYSWNGCDSTVPEESQCMLIQKWRNSFIFHLFSSFKLVAIHADKCCIATMGLFSLHLFPCIFSAFAAQFLPSHSRPGCLQLADSPVWIPSAEVVVCPVVTGPLWPKRWYCASQARTVWVSVMADLGTQGTECHAAVVHSRWYF